MISGTSLICRTWRAQLPTYTCISLMGDPRTAYGAPWKALERLGKLSHQEMFASAMHNVHCRCSCDKTILGMSFRRNTVFDEYYNPQLCGTFCCARIVLIKNDLSYRALIFIKWLYFEKKSTLQTRCRRSRHWSLCEPFCSWFSLTLAMLMTAPHPSAHLERSLAVFSVHRMLIF